MKNPKRRLFKKREKGFTLVELFVLIVIVGVLFGMLVPMVSRSSHGVARRVSCANNLRQLVLAMHNYESSFNELPTAMGRLQLETPSTHQGADRLSGLIPLLPYLEGGDLFEKITKPMGGNTRFPSGPAPWESSYPPWQEEIYMFQCPSSHGNESEFGRTSYGFCIGDNARNIHDGSIARGVFAPGLKTTLEQISASDGTSNTIAMGELGSTEKTHVANWFAIKQSPTILDNPAECLNLMVSASKPKYRDSVTTNRIGRGGCWADGAAGYSLFNTILPPGSPSAAVTTSPASNGIFSAGAKHSDGNLSNFCFADGSCHAISTTIDAGDPSKATLTLEQMQKNGFESPYGVWGALGSVNGGETIGEF